LRNGRQLLFSGISPRGPAAVMGGAVSGPKRGKRVAASPEAEAFLRTVGGFFASRDEVTKATPAFVQTNIATFFDDVGGGVILKQDVVGGIETQLDALYARASAAKEVLDGFGRRLVADAGLDPNQEMATEATDGEEVLRAYSAGPLKSRARAAEKAKDEYDGDAARLLDVVRGSIVCGDEASLVAVLKRVLEGFSDEAGEVCVVRSKNRFKKPLFNGYRDVLINLRLRLPDGTSMVVELQVHLVQILQFKGKTHVYYEYFRTYFSGNLIVVAERMEVLESIGSDGTASLLDAVNRALFIIAGRICAKSLGRHSGEARRVRPPGGRPRVPTRHGASRARRGLGGVLFCTRRPRVPAAEAGQAPRRRAAVSPRPRDPREAARAGGRRGVAE